MSRIQETCVCDRLASPQADKSAFMQELCDVLAAELKHAGASGGIISDVIWLKDDDGREGAIVHAVPSGYGFFGMTAQRCREILIDKRERLHAEAAQGRLV